MDFFCNPMNIEYRYQLTQPLTLLSQFLPQEEKNVLSPLLVRLNIA